MKTTEEVGNEMCREMTHVAYTVLIENDITDPNVVLNVVTSAHLHSLCSAIIAVPDYMQKKDEWRQLVHKSVDSQFDFLEKTHPFCGVSRG